MKTIVISLGGSLIIPDSVDYIFLDKLKKTLRRYYNTYRFVIVCGGGSIARKYINALKKEGKPNRLLSLAGIRATRANALFLMQFFGKEANDTLPINMREVKNNLKKNSLVICGALRFSKNSTSDTTAAKLAKYLKTEFVNLTNVDGLYSSDPKRNKNARFIPFIDWKKFQDRALKSKYSPGQHFVLDQQAAVLIRKYRIPTFIIGRNLKNLEKIFNGQEFIGTSIKGK